MVPQQPHGDRAWIERYSGADPRAMPWYTAQLDGDLAEAVAREALPPGSRVLDLGCGPGTAALHLAARGFRVDAVDMSPDAVEFGKGRAGALAARIAWHVGDVFEVPLRGPFDLALDRGLFHVFPDELRAPYAARVAGWLRPGAAFVLKTFSEEEPPGWGPRRVSKAEVEEAFGAHFDLEGALRSSFPGNLDHEPRAWLFTLRRR